MLPAPTAGARRRAGRKPERAERPPRPGGAPSPIRRTVTAPRIRAAEHKQTAVERTAMRRSQAAMGAGRMANALLGRLAARRRGAERSARAELRSPAAAATAAAAAARTAKAAASSRGALQAARRRLAAVGIPAGDNRARSPAAAGLAARSRGRIPEVPEDRRAGERKGGGPAAARRRTAGSPAAGPGPTVTASAAAASHLAPHNAEAVRRRHIAAGAAAAGAAGPVEGRLSALAERQVAGVSR